MTIPNVVIDQETGKPTKKSLNHVLGVISKRSGQGGVIQGAYVEGDFGIMNEYAMERLKESNTQFEEYDEDRRSYNLLFNNCGTFANDVIKQDGNARRNAPWIFNPAPYKIVSEYQKKFPNVRYNPRTNTTTSDIFKKEE